MNMVMGEKPGKVLLCQCLLVCSLQVPLSGVCHMALFVTLTPVVVRNNHQWGQTGPLVSAHTARQAQALPVPILSFSE